MLFAFYRIPSIPDVGESRWPLWARVGLTSEQCRFLVDRCGRIQRWNIDDRELVAAIFTEHLPGRGGGAEIGREGEKGPPVGGALSNGREEEGWMRVGIRHTLSFLGCSWVQTQAHYMNVSVNGPSWAWVLAPEEVKRWGISTVQTAALPFDWLEEEAFNPIEHLARAAADWREE